MSYDGTGSEGVIHQNRNFDGKIFVTPRFVNSKICLRGRHRLRSTTLGFASVELVGNRGWRLPWETEFGLVKYTREARSKRESGEHSQISRNCR